MKVLVADDDVLYRRLLECTLAGWGYEVIVACDGAAAWCVLDAEDAPSLALLDWVMPGLHGDQICRLVRQHPGQRYTWILLMTSRGDKADLLEGLQAGADDYLAKPFDLDELRARLNTGRRILQLQNDLISAREAMRRQAMRDSLTGVWNHAAILEILEREWRRGRREGSPVGVILADLDHFKRVNDTHGHLAGDAALRAVSDRILAAMRPYDLVGRYGGEEFLLVLPGCDEPATFKVCERIAGQAVPHESEEVSLTVSLGATVGKPSAAADVVALVRAADTALYRAKAAGRNRVELSSGS
jgi:diguanylate cyclase (GGDEF)-like protein